MGFVKDIMRRSVGFNPMGWDQARRHMRARIEEHLAHIPEERPEKSDGLETIVVVAPWLDTPVPWFTIAIGLMLAERGARVRFVIDDMPYGANALRHATVLSAIRYAMKPLEGRFNVTTLSDAPKAAVTKADEAEIARLAQLNATWALRGEMPQKGRAQLVERAIAQNSAAQAYIAGFFAEARAPQFLFTPGGVFGHSGLWMRAARSVGARVGSYDAAGQKGMLIEANGMACQAEDTPFAFRDLKDESVERPESVAHALRRGSEELAKRRAGKDNFQYQVAGSTGGDAQLEGGFLIALNSSWDAAALGPHRAYPTNSQWIVETVRHLLDHTDRPVIVRQHPAERNPAAATNDDYAALLGEAFGTHERLHFIAAQDPVNSYALLEKVCAVIVHTSTIGVEAAAFGRPVITGSASWYSQLGFVHFADNRAGYEALLQAAAAGELPLTDDMKRDAELCYYITQCCKLVLTPFNPANLAEWMAQPLAHWSSDTQVDRAMQALLTGTPFATLTHRASLDA